jgi:DNA-binding transcriptional regulator GbsR (MarR family)
MTHTTAGPLTAPEVRAVLDTLAYSDYPLTITELVEHTGIARSAVAGGLAALKRDRMVRAESCDDRTDRWSA